MRIAPINEMNSSSGMNFRGLWGKEKVTANYDETMGYEKTERFYYPFLDESAGEVKNVQEKYTRNSVNYNGGQYTMDYFEECHVNDKLRFTKSEWEQYSHNKSGISKQLKSIIETSLKMLKLKHYIIK